MYPTLPSAKLAPTRASTPCLEGVIVGGWPLGVAKTSALQAQVQAGEKEAAFSLSAACFRSPEILLHVIGTFYQPNCTEGQDTRRSGARIRGKSWPFARLTSRLPGQKDSRHVSREAGVLLS